MNTDVTKIAIEKIFRHEYGKIVAILVHKFGPPQIEKVEDAVQEALLKAMLVWPYNAIPKNPTGWLLKVATNRFIDSTRKDKKMISHAGVMEFIKEVNDKNENLSLDNEINDSQLKMIFACCHPSISQEYQIILSLKLIGGFSNKEIAKALLKKEETIAKSFTRAKKRLKRNISNLEIPTELGLRSRVNIVLKVIYLLFSEGYRTTDGALLIKKDICYEAIRLALVLSENKYCNQPNVNALIALMCFHASRFEARLDEHNEIVELAYHDRTKYNHDLFIIGNQYLELATNQSTEPSVYHLQAAISFCYTEAESFAKIDWKSIMQFYDMLIKKQRSPVITLNRLLSYSKVYGSRAALKELKLYEQEPQFVGTTLYYAIKAEIFRDIGYYTESELALRNAIDTCNNQLEKKHFTKKMNQLVAENKKPEQ